MWPNLRRNENADSQAVSRYETYSWETGIFQWCGSSECPQGTPHQTSITPHVYKQILLSGELPQTLDASRNDTKPAVGKGRCHLKTLWWMKNDTQRKVSNLHGFRVNFWGIAGLAVRRRWKVCGQALFYVRSEASWNAQTGCLVLISFIRTDTGCLAKVLRMPTHPSQNNCHSCCGKGFELPSIIIYH